MTAKRPMSSRDTKNPCIGRCRFDTDGECLGCHRTKLEVKGWKRLPDTAKAAINQRIGASDTTAKSRSKRLRKLDKKIGKLEAKLGALRAEREALADPASSASAVPPYRAGG